MSSIPALPPLLPEEQEAFHQEYSKYFRYKRGNFFHSLEVFRGVWDCIQLLCDIWQREMADLESLVDQYQMLPRMLFAAAHARFLTAIELSFSCCIGDAYSILRDGIESTSHAYKLSHEPNLTPIWANKHNSQAEEKAYNEIFTYKKKANLYPDKDGMNYLFIYYGQFCEMATHSSVTSLGNAFEDASTATNLQWQYRYFQTDVHKLAVLLFTVLQVSAHMEQAFFACFETRLRLDPDLANMRTRFSTEKETQRQYLKDRYKV